MPHCDIYKCIPNRKDKSIRFYRFPRNKYRDVWIKAAARKNWTPTKYSRICSIHFEEDYFYDTNKQIRLHPYAIPTLELPEKDAADNSETEYFDSDSESESDTPPETDPLYIDPLKTDSIKQEVEEIPLTPEQELETVRAQLEDSKKTIKELNSTILHQRLLLKEKLESIDRLREKVRWQNDTISNMAIVIDDLRRKNMSIDPLKLP